MIILRQKDFSDKKPKNLKKYKEYDGKKMTKSQQREAIDEEGEIAAHNTSRYANKHSGRGAGIGGAAGAALGYGGTRLLAKGLGRKKAAAIGAGVGLYGAAFGAILGAAKGTKEAKKAGHDRTSRELRLARRFDEDNRERGIDSDLAYETKREQSDRRREDLDRQRNFYMSQMAYNSWRR